MAGDDFRPGAVTGCPQLTDLTPTPSSGTVPLKVAFQVTVENGPVLGPYQWDFGDGGTAETSSPSASYTYQKAGTYTASVTAQGPAGCPAAKAFATINPTSACPQLTGMAGTPGSGPVPLKVDFQVSVENAPAVLGPYRWDFGDGGTAETSSPSTSHTYQSPGGYTASVTVGVPPGCPATETTATVTATPAGGPLDADTPVLLLPVQLQTRFAGSEASPELWVRIYPDTIHIDGFDPRLTGQERDHGTTYWTEVGKLGAGDDPVGPWRVLVAAHGRQRAAYIRLMTQPESDSAEAARTEQRDSSWDLPPKATLMPDVWQVTVYTAAGAIRSAAGTLVSADLALFFDPHSTTVLDPGTNPVDPGMKWLTDFAEAERKGMAVRVPLQPADMTAGIAQVIAVGIKSTGAEDGAAALEGLLDIQHYTQGFAVVPQGAPTKTTPDATSAYSSLDPGCLDSYRVEVTGGLAAGPYSNGQVLAAGLGIDPGYLQCVDHADGTEQLNAYHLARAVWPSTFGYFLRQMMADLLTEDQVNAARDFFVAYVRGRGRLPVIRVGRAPYGLLPVTSLTQWDQPDASAVERWLAKFVLTAMPTWTASVAQTPRITAGGDPDTELARVLGMDASSSHFRGRGVLGPNFLWNWLNFLGFNFAQNSGWWAPHGQAAQAALSRLGLGGTDPLISQAGFLDGFDLQLDTVAPSLSESEPLPKDVTLPDGSKGNYLDWIGQAAIDDLALQHWPGPAPEPTALLYRVLRASMLLEYVRAGVNLQVGAGVATPGLIKEAELAHLGAINTSDTAWQSLNRSIPGLNAGQSLKAYLQSAQAATDARLAELRDFKASLSYLAGLPTAELDRLLTETLDCCSHRLDAWASALANAILGRMRAARSQGLHLGGYGYVENLTARPGPADTAGYIHAPSPQQAALAAVLCSGHLSHAGTGSADLLNLDISSDRVQSALRYLDGVRQGQQLAALLGYQFEDGLHAAGLDAYTQAFRDAYPYTAQITDPGSGQPAAATTAPNVANGLTLQAAYAAHQLDPGGTWGPGLPSARPDQVKVAGILHGLDDVMNAISNLSVAEGVFQVMRGNNARAGGLLDAASRGAWAPEPEFLGTPRTGIDISHRILLLFTGDGGPGTHWPDPRTVRGSIEPRLDDWLARLLPDPATVTCTVSYTSGGNTASATITLEDLGAGPLDVLALANAGPDPAYSELAQRILYQADLPAGTTDAAIAFAAPGAGAVSFPDVVTAAAAFRGFVLGARGLQPNDLAAPEDADPQAEGLFVPELLQRADGVLAGLVSLQGPLGQHVATLGGLLAPGQPAPTRAELDAAAAAVAADLLALLPYGVPGCVPLPRNRQDPTAPPGAAEIQALLGQGRAAAAALAKRISDAQAYRTASLTASQPAANVITYFGMVVPDCVPALPRFVPGNAADLGFVFDPARSLVPADDPDAISRWLQQLTYVRPAASRLDTAVAAGRLLQPSPYTPPRALGQLPRQPDPDSWIALSYGDPTHAPSRGRLSMLALMEPSPYDPAGSHSGLLVDEWPERIPQPAESSGLAFHYGEPKARAPQCLLLALPPSTAVKEWNTGALLEIVRQALEWAAIRTVDLDSLTGLGQLLPALCFGLNTGGTSGPDTVSTDFGTPLK
jgi:PKD repeat protein